ncbi:hypothetical protein BKA67DRAFT_547708 [Truncatella angustata]|uniref:PinX1-related protein 1 n=1 Tax=Truncatella angustata TaxID=152316 RepID=A0A9P8UY47_9PEZI|nr:uncharacterized protein BKA67DRAFT_547708 [Truncatella angustata]KAH6660352.1 hypothetical protein BKA67DRAFT_547708 [Truncatella angustata]KAH8201867.1 hypothetical protein TruAng_003954 [Truncatella angustata]
MGLAGKKNKQKLNEDPNNTKWSRNETTFGQKILRSHGWEPGQYLGAKDASHASMHSAASSAPIKITIKDDNMGLGAKIRQKQAGECTGLDVFKDLLGRLNGESDESLNKKQAMRSELKTNLYIEQKFGPMRFVRGGLLVGDQITELVKHASETKQTAANVPTEGQAASVKDESDETIGVRPEKKEKKEKKSKKRKAENTDGLNDAETDNSDGKKQKKKRSREESSAEGSQAQSESDSERKRRKKEKKDKKSKKRSEEIADDAVEAQSRAKKEKKDKKDKKKRKEAAEASETPLANTANVVITSAAVSGTSTPSGTNTGTSTPRPLSRHMVRSRNIASKRMAMADMAALNQILFVKPV